jgi:hypothetical protein
MVTIARGQKSHLKTLPSEIDVRNSAVSGTTNFFAALWFAAIQWLCFIRHRDGKVDVPLQRSRSSGAGFDTCRWQWQL